jgi:DNA invertase Pin-like site-specific DNA recombinase
MIDSYAAYLRDSGGDDQELSVEQQEAEIRAWCVERGYILSRIFRDQARPGSSTVGREAFQEMMSHFRSGDCPEQGVIIWKFSRFARDIDDAQFYKADLRRRGYRILSVKDQIPDGLDGRFFESAIDWMNSRFLEDLSTDVKRGQRHLLEQYGAIGGVPPRGFKREPVHIADRRDGRPHIVHRWVPDPSLIDTVRLAWQMRAAGASYQKINTATRLYGSLNSYRTFFVNRLYIGELVVSGTVIEDYCRPVIDRETWDAVQKINTKNAHLNNMSGIDNPDHPRRAASSFLLSGLAYCAQCGAPLNGEDIYFKKTGKSYHYYACSRAQRRAGCTARKIPRATLENGMLDTLSDYILQPDNFKTLQDQLDRQESDKTEQIQSEKRAQERHLAQIRKKINNLAELLSERGAAARTLLQKLDELEKSETAALTEIARLNNMAIEHPPVISAAELERMAIRIRSLLAESDPETLRQILSGLIQRVTAERDGQFVRGIVYYFFMPKPPIPLGAPPYTHKIFTASFQIPYKRKPRR